MDPNYMQEAFKGFHFEKSLTCTGVGNEFLF